MTVTSPKGEQKEMPRDEDGAFPPAKSLGCRRAGCPPALSGALLAFLLLLSIGVEAAQPELGPLLFKDDFRGSLAQWHVELERPGTIVAKDGILDIEVPAGATLWFKHELRGPIAIAFDAVAVQAGGRYDRVSDLNCFWMASNPDGVAPVYARARSGKFTEYNDLHAYYVGLGGNSNTTSRFRRYIGDPVLRPLLPQHDLSGRDVLLVPNRLQSVLLIADGSEIQYWRDGRLLFRHHDPQPYTQGWFALRTTQSHLRIERFRIYALRYRP